MKTPSGSRSLHGSKLSHLSCTQCPPGPTCSICPGRQGGGTSLKPQSSSHQMIPPSPQKHSCFPPISKEEVSSLLLSKTNSLSTSSRTWHPQAPHPPAWTYSTEDSEGPEDAGEQVLSRGPCGREKEPQPIPLCPKQGPQPPASSLSSCTGLPRPFRLLAVPQNHATCNHLLSV